MAFNVLLALMIIFWTFLAVSGASVTGNVWFKSSATEFINYHYYESYSQVSLLRCATICGRRFGWDQIYYRDHVCYCLAPNYVSQHDNSISGQLPLQKSAVFQIKHDVSKCVDNGYRVFSCCGYCFKTFLDHKTWPEAEERCMKDGGHLASVQTQRKIENAMNLTDLFANGYAVYVGGHALTGTNDNLDYRWITGEAINISLWRENEPNNLSREKVVHLYSEGKLNNRQPTVPFSFLCEILIYN